MACWVCCLDHDMSRHAHWTQCKLQWVWEISYQIKDHVLYFHQAFSSLLSLHSVSTICLLWHLEMAASSLILLVPSPGRKPPGRPHETFLDNICRGTGLRTEALPGVMNNRELWHVIIWSLHRHKQGDFIWRLHIGITIEMWPTDRQNPHTSRNHVCIQFAVQSATLNMPVKEIIINVSAKPGPEMVGLYDCSI